MLGRVTVGVVKWTIVETSTGRLVGVLGGNGTDARKTAGLVAGLGGQPS